LFSIRHEFPTEWARFKAATIDGNEPTASLTLSLTAEHYPFWSVGRIGSLHSVTLYARTEKNTVTVSDDGGNSDAVEKNKSLGDLRTGRLHTIALPPPTGTFTLHLDDNTMDELWLAAAWGA